LTGPLKYCRQRNRRGAWAKYHRGLSLPDSRADPASVASQFYAAATGAGEWSHALSALATLTGSFTGELLGFGRDNALAFYCHNAIAPDLIEDFIAARGHDPAVNSRVRLGLQANPFDILDERDFTTSLDIERNPEYGQYLQKIDGTHLCLGNLLREDGMTVGLTVIRTAAQGNISETERRAFADVMPHVRAAVRTHLLLEDRQMAIVADTFEAVSGCAFVCAANGTLHALSSAAEALLRNGGWLTVRDSVLVAQTTRDTRRLHAAIHAAVLAGSGGSTLSRPFAIRNEAGHLLPLEAFPYVASGSLRGPGLAILLAKPSKDVGLKAAETARILFQLTEREAAIAAELVRGQTVAEIATAKGIAVGTIRVHLRNIFEKVGVNNQAQVVATLCSHL
jgi:DNA-binding CsgD family transcriptional regulator